MRAWLHRHLDLRTPGGAFRAGMLATVLSMGFGALAVAVPAAAAVAMGPCVVLGIPGLMLLDRWLRNDDRRMRDAAAARRAARPAPRRAPEPEPPQADGAARVAPTPAANRVAVARRGAGHPERRPGIEGRGSAARPVAPPEPRRGRHLG